MTIARVWYARDSKWMKGKQHEKIRRLYHRHNMSAFGN